MACLVHRKISFSCFQGEEEQRHSEKKNTGKSPLPLSNAKEKDVKILGSEIRAIMDDILSTQRL